MDRTEHPAATTKPALAMIVSSVLLIAACDVPTQSQSRGGGRTRDTVPTTRIEMEAESFSLAWDPDEGEIESYELAYRERGEEEWRGLASTPGDVTRYEVNAAELDSPSGTFEFAVRSVSADDSASDYHESTDPDARPEGGWYLDLQ